MSEAADESPWQVSLGYQASRGVDAAALANRAALVAALDHMPQADFGPLFAMFDPEATFFEAECLPYGGAHKGLAAIERALKQISETYSLVRADYHEVLAAGDYVMSYMTMTFKVAANGNTVSTPLTELFRFENGKIVEWRISYFDAALVARAIAG